ncbi:outer membrane lipoprotein-sorting protein [bacterium]|nr:outer membrane lipoprotein-sorting protein [bacterium]
MTITTTSGETRTFVYDSWSKNHGEKNLIRYLEPVRSRDQATLMLNHADDIWMYFPRTGRVRKLATHARRQKMEGSDFSYEDMGSGDTFVDDFTPAIVREETMRDSLCWLIELTRKPDADISYSRCLMWVTKGSYVPLVIDYYPENDPQTAEKRLIQKRITLVSTYPTAMEMVMRNLGDNTETVMEILDISYDLDLPDSMFTERELKR